MECNKYVNMSDGSTGNEAKNKSNANVKYIIETDHDPLVALEALLDIKRGSGKMVASNGVGEGGKSEGPLEASRPSKQHPSTSQTTAHLPQNGVTMTTTALSGQVSEQTMADENDIESQKQHSLTSAAAAEGGVVTENTAAYVSPSSSTSPKTFHNVASPLAVSSAPVSISPSFLALNGAQWNLVARYQGEQFQNASFHQSPSTVQIHAAHHAAFSQPQNATATAGQSHVLVVPTTGASPAPSSVVASYPSSNATVPSPIVVHPSANQIYANLPASVTTPVPNPLAALGASEYDTPTPVPTQKPVVSAPQPVVATQQPVVATQQPVVAAPQPALANHQPVAAAPQPAVAAHQPVVAAPQPVVATHQPVVTAPQPAIAAHQSVMAAPQPAVAAHQPVVAAPQPSVSAHQPSVAAHQPSVAAHQPSVAAHQPTVAAHQPTVAAHQPAVAAHQPAVAAHQPVVAAPQLAVAAPKPVVPVSAVHPHSAPAPFSREPAPPVPKVIIPTQVVSSRAAVVAKRPLPPSTTTTTSGGKEREKSYGNGPPPPGVIRSEEIQAALMSKPQRGRKRGNLSELERLELTRTRNREHAKSTRERKKARYQELLSNEEKLKQMEQRFKIYDERRQCLVKLMDIRSAMINELAAAEKEGVTATGNAVESLVQDGQSGDQADSQDATCSANTTETRGNRSISFSSNTATPPTVSSDAMGRIASFVDRWCAFTSGQVKWQDLVVDVNRILVTALPSFGASSSSGTSSLEGKQGIAMLSEHDRSTLDFIRSHCGLERSISDIRYRIAGGQDGVAVSPNSVGFANVEVLVKNESSEDYFAIKSCLVQVEFEKDSSKITSIGWCCPLAPNADSLSGQHGSNSGLERHVSFPSVVSLECSKPKEDQQGTPGSTTPTTELNSSDPNATNGPGMAI